MAIPNHLLSTECDLYRPFGSASPLTSAIPCRLVPDWSRGRATHATAFMWTHYLDLQENVDIRDNITRSGTTNALVYADGDEIRINGIRYVVVWVEMQNQGTTGAYIRAYLMRHS